MRSFQVAVVLVKVEHIAPANMLVKGVRLGKGMVYV